MRQDSFCSETPKLAEYFNAHPNLSVDVGQVLFGETTSMTGDGPLGYYLHKVTGRKWFSSDTEMETGCGIVPIEYKDKSLVHAVQWAAGLEWYLLVDDPWRLAMSTDHPNGGSFLAYPEIIALLMDRGRRNDVLNTLPAGVRKRTVLGDLTREYTLDEIAIITRAAPAQILGLDAKGHLGVGADADVTIYSRNCRHPKDVRVAAVRDSRRPRSWSRTEKSAAPRTAACSTSLLLTTKVPCRTSASGSSGTTRSNSPITRWRSIICRSMAVAYGDERDRALDGRDESSFWRARMASGARPTAVGRNSAAVQKTIADWPPAASVRPFGEKASGARAAGVGEAQRFATFARFRHPRASRRRDPTWRAFCRPGRRQRRGPTSRACRIRVPSPLWEAARVGSAGVWLRRLGPPGRKTFNRGEKTTVGRKGDRDDGPLMAGQRRHRAFCSQIPQPDGVVGPARGGQFSVGREDRAKDGGGVSGERGSARGRSPHPTCERCRRRCRKSEMCRRKKS